MENADRSAVLILAAITSALDEQCSRAATHVGEVPLRVLSAADGTWKYTLDAPTENWLDLAFPVDSWDALASREMDDLPWDAPGAYQQRICRKHVAGALILPPSSRHESPHGPVWIRKVFDIPTPTSR